MEAALTMGVDQATVTNWELGHTRPARRFLPAIKRFLEVDDSGCYRRLLVPPEGRHAWWIEPNNRRPNLLPGPHPDVPFPALF